MAGPDATFSLNKAITLALSGLAVELRLRILELVVTDDKKLALELACKSSVCRSGAPMSLATAYSNLAHIATLLALLHRYQFLLYRDAIFETRTYIIDESRIQTFLFLLSAPHMREPLSTHLRTFISGLLVHECFKWPALRRILTTRTNLKSLLVLQYPNGLV
jgi:hypothetical protein